MIWRIKRGEDRGNVKENKKTNAVSLILSIVLLSLSSSAAMSSSWGMDLSGVFRGIETDDKVIALTFDACGSDKRSHRGREMDYDEELIAFLLEKAVPATLFVNERWIKAHPDLFSDLASDTLFEIGNHGTRHVPLSLTGRSAYGIAGTKGRDEVIAEVEGCGNTIESLTGSRPLFFRSGTAHYDEGSVSIVTELGYVVAGFSVNGDGGATFSSDQVRDSVMSVGPGGVVLCHMNHPESGTAEGVRAAVEKLLEDRYRFVTLSELYGMR